MWHLREASHNNFVFPTGNLSDQQGKRCHKFTHVLHFQSYCIYQLCEQENFNNWTTLTTLSKLDFFSVFGFSLLGLKVFFRSCFKKEKFLVRSYIDITFLVSLYNDFLTILHFFTFFVSFYSFYTFLFEPLAPDWLNPSFSCPFRS